MLLKLLGLPISAPLAGIRFAMQQIAELADQELSDDSVVREQLLVLQLQLEEGEIDEDEFVERETELIQRLREIRAYREQLAREQAGSLPTEDDDSGVNRRVIVETRFGDDDRP